MISEPQANAAAHLPGLLAPLGPVLDHYGYLAVAGLVALEDFGVPVPGETVLIAAAVYAGLGRLNVVAVAVVAVLAAIIGDNIGFAIGAYGGRPLLDRYGRYVLLTPERLDRAEAFFTRHGGKIVTVARFFEGLRQVNGIAAGLSEMRWKRFLVFNALGAALWVALWVGLGDLAGSHMGALYPILLRFQYYLLGAAGLLVAAAVGRHLLRRRRHRQPRRCEGPQPDGNHPPGAQARGSEPPHSTSS